MEKGNWVTPDGKKHPGVFYGGSATNPGEYHYDIPGQPQGQLYGHWESEGEISEAPKWAKGKE